MKEKKDFEWKKLKYYKESKNEHFPKGLVRDFVQKSKFPLSFFFTEIMSEKIVFGYFKEKTIILDQKLKFQQGPKNGLFFKGVSPRTWFKNRTFSYLLFSQKFYQKT